MTNCDSDLYHLNDINSALNKPSFIKFEFDDEVKALILFSS